MLVRSDQWQLTVVSPCGVSVMFTCLCHGPVVAAVINNMRASHAFAMTTCATHHERQGVSLADCSRLMSEAFAGKAQCHAHIPLLSQCPVYMIPYPHNDLPSMHCQGFVSSAYLKAARNVMCTGTHAPLLLHASIMPACLRGLACRPC